MKIIFFGTPEFSAQVLEFLIRHDVNVVAVITKPDQPKGRSNKPIPTPVKVVAQNQTPPIPLHQPPLVSAPEFADTLKQYDADLFVVVAYGEIIKQHLLDMPHLGCINVHPSLLPKYRGAAPIQRSIINGELVTGVTIMHMARKMDAGDIIEVVEVPIEPNITFPELEQTLCSAGCQSLLHVLQQFEENKNNVKQIPQDHEKATYAPKIELEDCELNWSLPALQLHNLIRGVTPDPGAWCYVTLRGQRKRLRILSSDVVSDEQGSPGKILVYGKEGFVVACGDQALRIISLQLEGKKAMSAKEFMHGYPQADLLQF